MRSDTWLADQLPAAMNDDDFLMRFLHIIQDVSDTLLDQIDTLPHMFDPSVAPDRMLQEMATWLGITWMDEDLDVAEKRRVIAGYASLVRRRGTVGGLRDLLQLLGARDVVVRDSAVRRRIPLRTGGASGAAVDDAVPLPHVRISARRVDWIGVPSGALPAVELERRQLDLVRVIRDEIPAAATFELVVGGDVLWPPADAGSAVPEGGT